MKHKIITVILMVIVVVSIFATSCFAYNVDFGTRLTDRYTTPYNLAARLNTSTDYLSIANTPFRDTNANSDRDHILRFYRNSSEYSILYNTSYMGNTDGSLASSFYAELDSTNPDDRFTRLMFYYMSFKKLNNVTGKPYSTINVYTEPTTNFFIEFQYRAYYYTVGGNLAYGSITEKVYPVYNEITRRYEYTFYIDDFANEYGNYPVIGYGNINVKCLNISNARSYEVIGYSESSVNISSSELFPSNNVTNVEVVNPNILEWLTKSVEAFTKTEIFPNVTVGGLLLVFVAVPLCIAFLKFFVGG